MRYGRRLLGWITYLGFLAVVGVVVFHYVRYTPRCVIHGHRMVIHLSQDGKRLVTAYCSGSTGAPEDPQVIRVWDLNTGKSIHAPLDLNTADGFNLQWTMSPDGRILAVDPYDATLRLIDWSAGTERRVQVGESEGLSMLFSEDGQWLCVEVGKKERSALIIHVSDGKEALCRPNEVMLGFALEDDLVYFQNSMLHTVTGWSLTTGAKVIELHFDADYAELMPDGRSLLVGHEHDKRFLRGRARLHRFEIWNLRTGRVRLASDKLSPSDDVQASVVNERYLQLLQCIEGILEVMELETGRKVAVAKVKDSAWAEISHDDSLCLIRNMGSQKSTMFDMATGRELWSITGSDMLYFLPNSHVLAHQRSKCVAESLDAWTGRCLAVMPFTQWPTETPFPVSKDGRYYASYSWEERKLSGKPRVWEQWSPLWLQGAIRRHGHGSQVIDTTTGRVQFHVPANDEDGWSLHISKDGATLANGTAPDADWIGFRVWDVHPHRAWTWALVASAGTGLGLWGLRRGVQRLRRRGVDEPKQQTA